MNLFVIPAFNEEANVPRLLADLERRPMLWDGGHVILVDDGSTDGTVPVAAAYDGPLPLTLLRQVPNQGAGRAFDRGFRHALGLSRDDDDLVITLESDTTSDLDALESMLALAHAGTDIVLASHHGQGELLNVARHRRALSTAAAFAMRHGAGLSARTVSSFFRVYRVEVLSRGYGRYGDDLIRESGFACKAEILMKLTRLDATVAEVPVALDWARREGESKMRIVPTIRGYTRMMARQLAAREPSREHV